MVAPANQPETHAAATPSADAASSSLSPHDHRLVAALVNPSTEGDALLAAFDPAGHADWLERPEVRRAIAAAEEFRDLRLRARATQRVAKAMDRLDAVLDHAADLTDEKQRTETRRAASLLFRVGTQYLAGSSGAMATARRGYGDARREPRARSRPEGDPSPSHRLTVSPSQPPGQQPTADSQPPTPPASKIPGLDTAVAAFLRAAGSPDGLADAAAHIAEHRKEELGAGFEPWLRSRCALIGAADARPGFTLHQDMLDCAVHAVTLPRPDAPVHALLFVVLERYEDGRNKWAIAEVVTPDSS